VNRIEAYFSAKLDYELARFHVEDELLRQANAGEVYYDMSNPATRTLTACDGNDFDILVGQWRGRDGENAT
jgi:hypothetical protein